MARPPAGPIGNSPRDVRDDAVGVPAENVQAPEPPRWPPKRKKITGNTFHAKVSGGTSSSRADRKPHFRRGGMVSGFASGGSVAAKMEKRDELPGEQKNDPFAKQNIKKAKGGPVAKAGRFQAGGFTSLGGRADDPGLAQRRAGLPPGASVERVNWPGGTSAPNPANMATPPPPPGSAVPAGLGALQARKKGGKVK